MILSPVILNYLRVEMSKIEVAPSVAARSEQIRVAPADPSAKTRL
jgi:hypothetical protein